MLPGHIILDVPRGDAHGRLPWISEDAHDAAAALVSAKYKLDADRRLKNQYPIRPETFVNYALPLANASVIDETPGPIDFIPSEFVIGATWSERWFPLPIGTAARDLCDRLDESVRARSESWPLLFKVGDLPLWYAQEGKNRVELYQSLQRPILGECRTCSHYSPIAETVVRRGSELASISLPDLPDSLAALPVRVAADLLVACGAQEGAPLTAEDERSLVPQIKRRAKRLDENRLAP